ncbi:DUF6504 family protein [Deinococcus humi]|uniref:Uncharacterized protein n=1 Tax=Deinococcus humi TaxID=662880 RepID=A0A7W8NFV6_9DEIO|nr:DUF6504 family protein [Deinococcus humi]MBB5365849.1 hypothetical protein [Deinococcus humi]GGO38947.1 hypothetical protein GCM10008949_46330 [Deinococcus humi]
MKAVQQAVEVSLTPAGGLERLIWQGRAYAIQGVLDQWRYGGRWWRGEAPRDCFLVQAGGLLAELHHEDGGVWWLARIQD